MGYLTIRQEGTGPADMSQVASWCLSYLISFWKDREFVNGDRKSGRFIWNFYKKTGVIESITPV